MARFSCARFSRILRRKAGSSELISVTRPALQARAHAIVEAVELAGGRAEATTTCLPAIEQRIDDVLELLLGLLPAHELEVVDQENVDRTEFVLERQGILALDGLDELIAEALGRQIEHLRFACAASPPRRWRAADASCRARRWHADRAD